jgi:hypothetical protein
VLEWNGMALTPGMVSLNGPSDLHHTSCVCSTQTGGVRTDACDTCMHFSSLSFFFVVVGTSVFAAVGLLHRSPSDFQSVLWYTMSSVTFTC